MRNNAIAILLTAALGVSALGNLVLGMTFVSSMRELLRMQDAAVQVQQRRAMAQALANACVEYGRRNPAIVPILKAADARQQSPLSSAPAAPPNTRTP